MWDDYVFEATAARGVEQILLPKALRSHDQREMLYVTCDRPDAVIAAARSQLGKPYDFDALWGAWRPRPWTDESRWFGAELVAWSLARAGCPLVPDAVTRVTPADLWERAYGKPRAWG